MPLAPMTPDLVRVAADPVAHEARPAERDFFALQSSCVTCGRIVYWRLGTGEWDHAEQANAGRSTGSGPAQLAHQARRHGYHAPDRHTAYVHCPQCRSEVYADPARVGGRSGDDRAELDAAILAHLPHCTNGA